MNSKFFWVMGTVIMFAAGPAYAGQAMQMWSCGMEDEMTEKDVEARAEEWLKAARQLDGGKNLEAMVLFPIAVNASGDTDLIFMVTAPSFAEWGRFWDVYPDSDAAAGEDGGMFCPDSVLWEASKVKVKAQ
ncbi:MAG: hypothetical protein JRG96_20790 [Deltaproteobacteria bacterium]|nr:hypothetical protein [Deltaproteobacteria bacterium]